MKRPPNPLLLAEGLNSAITKNSNFIEEVEPEGYALEILSKQLALMREESLRYIASGGTRNTAIYKKHNAYKNNLLEAIDVLLRHKIQFVNPRKAGK